MTQTIRSFSVLLQASAAVAALLLGPAASAADATDARVTRNAYFSDGRSQEVPDRVAEDELAGDSAAVESAGKTRRSQQRKSAATRSESINSDFWFYSADLVLFGDHDGDGYFHGIDLLFDADTVYERADVYAVLYLSENGGPWFEYAATDVFPIFGATSDDDFAVVSELVAGYPSGSYDLLIELWDTWDDSFVAEIGPADSSALAFIPLEDTERDTPYEGPEVIVVEDGGGSLGVASLLLLAGVALRRRRFFLRPGSGPYA